ncbi:isoleucine--tRNA ligase [Microbacterium sp. gxy059]|uniref:isoleucine--tRNA ligase n=1 Tax=Microbacterium sp. gxy059 TaxID=2957199 RepID=UPI003D983EF9
MTYPKSAFGPAADAVTPSPRFPDIEREILEFWKQDDTFRASIAQREGAEEWVFYDGPPFANGLPHYGHLLTGYAKDLFPRFHTMLGQKVDRVFGWDTHGLPAELEAMKQLGITEKSEIEQMGIDAFNAKARESVLAYTREWEDYVTRQARWVDFERGYKTLNPTFMESVLWAFSQLHGKGLAYEGYRVLPYCWRDQTPLSNHELRMDDDVYKDRQDPSVTVTFPLAGAQAERLGVAGARALAWTTTPWTLPTNLSLAVGPEIVYAVVPAGPNGASEGAEGEEFLLAEEMLPAHAKELGYDEPADAVAAIRTRVTGAELDGTTYEPLFDYFADTEKWGTQNAWRVIADDYVSTGDGTGIVHQAPYGEDDHRVHEANGIPSIVSLGPDGRFLDIVPDVAGELWSDANTPLVRLLRQEHRLLRLQSYVHSYPHCWRCRNPLIYMPVSSWFVRVTDVKDRLLELNEQITWAPENVKHGQFGKWLEGARDWSISRNRFWGTPIPVWKSDDPNHPRVDVYGSLEELERDFGALPRNAEGEVDLHRPYIDELTRQNPDDPTGKSTMRRIEDVFDVWFDSGSMPFAQVHYPFENKAWFDEHSPADFIVEYIGQTRGWFYVMHVLSGALFDRPAYTGVSCHGIVLGNDGQKMSKSLRNYPDVNEVFDRDGSDAMRWFLMSSSVLRGGNLVVTEEGIRAGVREFLLPLWNSWYFFSTYANAAGGQGGSGYEATWRADSTDVLDRYILALTGDLVRDVRADLEALDSTTASERLRDFAEVLTNWYIRRSRDRFWTGVTDDPASREAFDTLYTVLETLCRVAAPMIPLVSERVWQGLTGGRSVHLTDWPDADAFPAAADIREAMDAVREASSVANALRKREKLRVRLPLARLTVVTAGSDALAQFEDILRDELNVKEVVTDELRETTAADYGISHRLTVNARAAGPRLGKQVQQAIRAAKSGDWSEQDGVVTAGGLALEEGEYELALDTAGRPDGEAIATLPSGGFVILDTTMTPELEAEGLARDVIRAVQDARRAADFDVSDRIGLSIVFDSAEDASVFPLRGPSEAKPNTVMLMEETLTSFFSPIVRSAETGPDQTVDDWESSHGFRPEHVALVPAGTYANKGALTIAVSRQPQDDGGDAR